MRLSALIHLATGLALAALLGAAEQGNVLLNPSMSEGATAPAAWSKAWASEGAVAAARDTTVFRSAPAALRIDSVNGTAKGCISQSPEGLAGRTLRTSGWVKPDGVARAYVGIGAFDADWKLLAWETLIDLPAGSPDRWTSYARTVAMPAAAVHINVAASIEGAGKAWFDDLAVCPVP